MTEMRRRKPPVDLGLFDALLAPMLGVPQEDVAKTLAGKRSPRV